MLNVLNVLAEVNSFHYPFIDADCYDNVFYYLFIDAVCSRPAECLDCFRTAEYVHKQLNVFAVILQLNIFIISLMSLLS